MPGGRPTVYRPENAEIARRACTAGATNRSLAALFSVSRRTVDNWIARISEFGDAVREGREVADLAVVSALFARATGMELKKTKVFCHRGQPVTASYTDYLPPDVSACMFWLRNRRPAQWHENRRECRSSSPAKLARKAGSDARRPEGCRARGVDAAPVRCDRNGVVALGRGDADHAVAHVAQPARGLAGEGVAVTAAARRDRAIGGGPVPLDAVLGGMDGRAVAKREHHLATDAGTAAGSAEARGRAHALAAEG